MRSLTCSCGSEIGPPRGVHRNWSTRAPWHGRRPSTALCFTDGSLDKRARFIDDEVVEKFVGSSASDRGDHAEPILEGVSDSATSRTPSSSGERGHARLRARGLLAAEDLVTELDRAAAHLLAPDRVDVVRLRQCGTANGSPQGARR